MRLVQYQVLDEMESLAAVRAVAVYGMVRRANSDFIHHNDDILLPTDFSNSA